MQVRCNFQLSFYQLDGNNLFVFCSYELSRRNLIDKLYHIEYRPYDQLSMSESVVVKKDFGISHQNHQVIHLQRRADQTCDPLYYVLFENKVGIYILQI